MPPLTKLDPSLACLGSLQLIPMQQTQVTWDEDQFHTDKTDNDQRAQNATCETP